MRQRSNEFSHSNQLTNQTNSFLFITIIDENDLHV